MRILFVIPHYFGTGPSCYGSSDTSKKERRIASLRACIASLHRQFGSRQNLLLYSGQDRTVNQMTANDLDVVVCVCGNNHLLDELNLPEGSFRAHSSNIADPKFLGYECYDIYRESFGKYDWYCYLEDDIVISDPLFFCKLRLFYRDAGPSYLLQPNRYEFGSAPELTKSYIDGPLWQDSADYFSKLRLPGCRDEMPVHFGDVAIRMKPAENPHASCFFLTNRHLAHMLEQPWYGDHVVGYAGPLESAATMYITTLFHVFKPADECAAFLEVHHHYQKFQQESAIVQTRKHPEQGNGNVVHPARHSHWLEDLRKPDRVKIHESWFRTDTIDYARHERMYEAVFKCLVQTNESKWLTVGDGRYGLDALRMGQHGFLDVTATDIDDSLLTLSRKSGLLKQISSENAESFSFADKSFDYILCKESFHHFSRPMLALYEMIRVARKAVVLIEPQDGYIDLPIGKGKHLAVYEEDGNYIYTLSRRELEKVVLGLGLPSLAVKNMCDYYVKGLEDELAVASNPVYVNFLNKIEEMESRCKKFESKYDMLMSVLFIEAPDAGTVQLFNKHGWDIIIPAG